MYNDMFRIVVEILGHGIGHRRSYRARPGNHLRTKGTQGECHRTLQDLGGLVSLISGLLGTRNTRKIHGET